VVVFMKIADHTNSFEVTTMVDFILSDMNSVFVTMISLYRSPMCKNPVSSSRCTWTASVVASVGMQLGIPKPINNRTPHAYIGLRCQ
jgi:hypothetical protein